MGGPARPRGPTAGPRGPEEDARRTAPVPGRPRAGPMGPRDAGHLGRPRRLRPPARGGQPRRGHGGDGPSPVVRRPAGGPLPGGPPGDGALRRGLRAARDAPPLRSPPGPGEPPAARVPTDRGRGGRAAPADAPRRMAAVRGAGIAPRRRNGYLSARLARPWTPSRPGASRRSTRGTTGRSGPWTASTSRWRR